MLSMETHHDSGGILVVDAMHPSLDCELDRFLGALHDEPRFFGPSASANPKPFPSLIEALRGRRGFRLAAVECGRVIGIARVDEVGELFIAVVRERRGAGVGTALGRAAMERAARLGYRRIVLRPTRRSRAANRVGQQLGCAVVERSRGRTDIVLFPNEFGARRSA
jgi:GNAT superfamily N-acetyltransferase